MKHCLLSLFIAVMAMLAGCATSQSHLIIDRPTIPVATEAQAHELDSILTAAKSEEEVLAHYHLSSGLIPFLAERGLILSQILYKKGIITITSIVDGKDTVIVSNPFDNKTDTIIKCYITQKWQSDVRLQQDPRPYGFVKSDMLGYAFMDTSLCPVSLKKETYMKVLEQETNHALLQLALARKSVVVDERNVGYYELVGEINLFERLNEQELLAHQTLVSKAYAGQPNYALINECVGISIEKILTSTHNETANHFKGYLLDGLQSANIRITTDLFVKYHKNYPEQALALMISYKRAFLESAKGKANPFLNKHGLNPLK